MPGKIEELADRSISYSILTALILFIDNAEHAAVEPALAADIPAERAPQIYEALLTKLRNLTALFAGEKYLFYSHYPNWNDGWDINHYRKRIQSGESLPRRITDAVANISEENPESIVWLSVGVVSLDAGLLAQFAAGLDDADVVIGEAGSANVLALGFGTRAFGFPIPENMNGDGISALAEAAGLRVARIPLPAPPATTADLEKLGLTF